MAEYIKKEDIEQKIQDGLNNLVLGHDAIEVLGMIYEMPAADFAPVRHGRWVKMDTTGLLAVESVWNCSSCRYPVGVSVAGSNYCPNCGAKMDGVDDE